jgi:hypothetical protein
MPELNVNDLTQAKKATAALALFGLCEEVIKPSCPVAFVEAWRIVSTESIELKKISTIFEMDIPILQKNIFAYLISKGFCLEEV